jgi:hypothetical protein
VKQVGGLVAEHDLQGPVQAIEAFIKVPAPGAADPEQHPILAALVKDESPGRLLYRASFQRTEVSKKDHITMVYRFNFDFDMSFRKKSADLAAAEFIWVSLHEWAPGP